MEAASVCFLADAMFRLPAKLDRLLVSHGHTLPRGAQDEIPLIKQDLEKMIVFLQEHNDSGAEDCAMIAKCLTKEVRELSYDMEDSVDQYEHAAGTRRWILSPRRKKYKITCRRGKVAITQLPEKLKWRLWMANKIREFSMRSQEVLQRYNLFNHPGGSIAAPTSARCDPPFGSWHPTLYGEPVGIDAPLKKLELWLDKDGEQKLKVVSLVGFGGVGKTTLASKLYRRIGGQFECRAFVRTSRKPDVRRLLISMLSQVRPHQSPHTWKVPSLIADIRTYLQDKRYLIVVDDIWDTQTWDIVNRALPNGNLCSGILITTEVDDVALKCCGYDSKYVFMMKPLGHDDSSKLFFNTAFGPNYGCPPELSEAANSIIRKCAGLPLAMVTVASILVSQMGKPEQWDYVNKSLDYGLRKNPNSEGMKQVLNLSYNSLPEHLKACVMYLSIYEEDRIIQKDDVVKQWIAEGFIHATEENDKEEISRSYFDELIRSRMIRPVHSNDNDDVLSCSVHYMVLDFVTHKSVEENFVTAIDYCEISARLADKVRRLSLHFGNAEATSPTNMRLSQVRTLAFFGVFKCLPSIVDFGLLQVLILHIWSDDESISFDLTRVSKLFRLRYLHVTCNATLEVPQTQIRGLRYLETLKIDARVSAVPSDIVHLPGLLHLSLPIDTNLPNGIARMTSLCTLGYFDLSVNSIETVKSLGELTNLRELQLACSTVLSSYLKNKMDSMSSLFTKLRNLRSVTLEPSSILDVRPSCMSISCDGLSSVSSPPAHLQRFEWLPRICTFSNLPKWIGHLSKLCILKIGVRELVSNDVDVLRGLPSLTVLSLYVRTKPTQKIVFSKTGFSVLKYVKFRWSVPWMEFDVDAMPNLRRLKLGFDANGVDQHITVPVGIEHLTGLKEISAKIGGAGGDDPDRMAAESALRYAIKMHPARPTFNMQRVDRMFTGKDDYNSGFEEEEHMTVQKQDDIMEEDANEKHQVLQKNSREDANKDVRRRNKQLKWNVQVRVSSSENTEGADGFSWKKYGEKNTQDSKHPISYYSCSYKYKEDCLAKKKMQRMDSDPIVFNTMYVENHTCRQGMNLQLQTGHEQSSVSTGVKAKGSVQGLKRKPHRKILPKWSTQVRMSPLQNTDEHNDGFSWVKYGQKDIVGSKHPRVYYRCKQRNAQSCEATKHLQRTDGDPLLFDAMYKGNHTCYLGANKRLRLGHEQNPVSSGVKSEGSSQGLEQQMPPRMAKLKTQMTRRMQVRVGSMQDIGPDDGFRWRKYGQKDKVVGFKYPRAYFKCAQRGCPARKHMQRTDIDPLLFDVVYDGEHTCAQSDHSLLQHRQEQNSADSVSQVTYEEVSGSVAGVPFTSPAMSGVQATREEPSRSRSRVGFMSPATSSSHVTYAAASGSTTGSRTVSPVMSESQVTYEGVSTSTAGSWGAPAGLDDLLDLNSPSDDYAEEICFNPAHEDFHIGPPISPKSPN